MPQEFQILRCYACEKFQVHHVKKAKKWQCKVCGEKQSLKKAFFIGSSRDCRLNVQEWNFKFGQQKMNSVFEHNNPDNACFEDDFSSGELFKTEDGDTIDLGDCMAENLQSSESYFENSQNAFDSEIPCKKQRCESFSESKFVVEKSTNPPTFLLGCKNSQDQEEIIRTSAIKDNQEKNSTDLFYLTNEKEFDSIINEPGTSKLNCTDSNTLKSRAITIQNRGFQLILNEAKKQRINSSFDGNW